MIARRTATLAIVACVVFAASVSYAEHEPGIDGCPRHISDLGPDAPNAEDKKDDWNGVVFGNGTAPIPTGDIYREGTDVTAAWFSRTDGVLHANIQVNNLSTLQPNAIFYFLWDYEGPKMVNPGTGEEQDATRRWVSARFRGYEIAYTWGYEGGSNLPGSSRSLVTMGETTGTVTEGANGTISIAIPKGDVGGVDANAWGAPEPGTVLAGVSANSRILVGSPSTLPPNPTGLRNGYVFLVDETTGDQCDAYVD